MAGSFDWKELEEAKKSLLKRAEELKKAFVQLPGGAQAGDPAAGGAQMDPAAGGAPMDPAMMDPAMAGGMPPPGDPAAGGMPMDPAMAGMDPAMLAAMRHASGRSCCGRCRRRDGWRSRRRNARADPHAHALPALGCRHEGARPREEDRRERPGSSPRVGSSAVRRRQPRRDQGGCHRGPRRHGRHALMNTECKENENEQGKLHQRVLQGRRGSRCRSERAREVRGRDEK